ncbi:MAG: CRISPR-associated endonuclease Cas2 [Devosiaceae bacterium]|nr:CRISPR-associated endonuclease Cas2 [Devosiaceae bacterium]
MNNEMTMVFTYDITRARTRRKISKMLEEQAVRVQKSVFEARMSEKAAKNLFKLLSIHLDDGDNLRMYALSRTGLRHSLAYGGAPIPEDGEYWLL